MSAARPSSPAATSPAPSTSPTRRLAGRMDEVPEGGQLLVNCRSGARSARASAYLKRAGYDVVNLKGGMLAWEKSTATVEN
jgi:rhodanese-related sulfurtransferase